jgi:hypothetical protein
MRIPSLPPRIGWPLFVVGLLSISISASVYTLFSANSDGGAVVVDNYYAKGKQWDEQMSQRRAGDALTLDIDIASAAENQALQAVTLTVRDSSGTPVTDLSGSLRALRPNRDGVQATAPLDPTDAPGVYRQLLHLDARGLWDLELKTTYRGDAVLKSVRVEL